MESLVVQFQDYCQSTHQTMALMRVMGLEMIDGLYGLLTQSSIQNFIVMMPSSSQ